MAAGCFSQSGSTTSGGDGPAAGDNANPNDASPVDGTKGGIAANDNGLLAGGGNTAPTAADANVANANAALPNTFVDARYLWALVGRFDLADPNKPRFSLPGSKIGVRFTGTSLAGLFVDTAYDSFDVSVDGVDYAAPSNAFAIPNPQPVACLPVAMVPSFDGSSYPGCLLLNQSANQAVPTLYPIVSGLAPGEHTAWLAKRSEYTENGGAVQLFGFVVDANAALLPPPAQFRRRIEVIGDSSSVGYGAALRTPCSNSTRACDANRSLASYLGQYLHAEAVNTGASGQGVYLSYYDQNGDHNLPVQYRRVTPFAAKPYDFTQDHVDVVVLSAGGDDLWGNSGSGYFNNNNAAITTPARTMFVQAYTVWLTEIRGKRPDASIVVTLTYGASGADVVTLGSALKDSVTARNAAGDANVAYFEYFPANDANVNPKNYGNVYDAASAQNLTFGCRGHAQPGLAQYLAGILGPTIAKKMGWTDAGY